MCPASLLPCLQVYATRALFGLVAPQRHTVLYGCDAQPWASVRAALRKGDVRDGEVTVVVERAMVAAGGADGGGAGGAASSSGDVRWQGQELQGQAPSQLGTSFLTPCNSTNEQLRNNLQACWVDPHSDVCCQR